MEALLVRSPLQRLCQLDSSRRLTVLCYHGIDDEATFEQHLQILVSEARAVSVEEVLHAERKALPIAPGAVLLTFDDAGLSLLNAGLPLLREYDVPAVAFVVAGHLDNDQPFWWDEVAQLSGMGGWASGFERTEPRDLVRMLKRVPNETRLAVLDALRATSSAPAPRNPQLRTADLTTLEAAGVAVGNHSLTHPCLPKCSPAIIASELSESQEILASALGHRPISIAYPNGDVDETVLRVAAQQRFGLGFLFDHQLAKVPIENPLRISRARVNSTTNLNRFRAIVSGLHPTIHRLLGRH